MRKRDYEKCKICHEPKQAKKLSLNGICYQCRKEWNLPATNISEDKILQAACGKINCPSEWCQEMGHCVVTGKNEDRYGRPVWVEPDDENKACRGKAHHAKCQTCLVSGVCSWSKAIKHVHEGMHPDDVEPVSKEYRKLLAREGPSADDVYQDLDEWEEQEMQDAYDAIIENGQDIDTAEAALFDVKPINLTSRKKITFMPEDLLQQIQEPNCFGKCPHAWCKENSCARKHSDGAGE